MHALILTFDVSIQAVFVAVGVEVAGRVGMSMVRRLRRRVIVAHEPHATVPTPAMLGLYTHLIFIPEKHNTLSVMQIHIIYFITKYVNCWNIIFINGLAVCECSHVYIYGTLGVRGTNVGYSFWFRSISSSCVLHGYLPTMRLPLYEY